MKLINATLLKRFREVGHQSETENPWIICKFFNPTGAGNWFAISYDPIDKIFFGYVSIFGDHCDELGSFSLRELEEFKGRFGLGIERDIYFQPKKLSEVKKQLYGN
jgi:hypothetical protein